MFQNFVKINNTTDCEKQSSNLFVSLNYNKI